MAARIRVTLIGLFLDACDAYTLAGYTFETDVGAAWASLDVGLAAMSNASRYQDWAGTLASFDSVSASINVSLASLAPVPSGEYKVLTTSYWGSPLQADTVVRDSILGTGPVAGWDASSRRELLTKSAAYEVVRQYIFYRLYQGVEACHATDNQTHGAGTAAHGVEDWEIGYALHAGSLEGTEGIGSGKSTYALGDKRCPQFDTCVGDSPIATNNQRALEGWLRGVAALSNGECFTALREYHEIVSQLTVPLVQGMLREAYEVDPEGGAATADGVVEVAEGWAFTSAILPQIALCNATIGATIRTNMALSLNGANGAHVASGFRTLKREVESIYPCLGITCADVGGMLSNGEPIAGMEPCTESREPDLMTVVIALATALGVVLLIMCVCAIMCDVVNNFFECTQRMFEGCCNCLFCVNKPKSGGGKKAGGEYEVSVAGGSRA